MYLLAGNGLQAAEPIFSAIHEGIDIRHGCGFSIVPEQSLNSE